MEELWQWIQMALYIGVPVGLVGWLAYKIQRSGRKDPDVNDDGA